MSKQQERKEVIKNAIIENADFLAENLAKNKDFELRSSSDGLAIYKLEKKRCM